MNYPKFIDEKGKRLSCSAVQYETFNTNGIPIVYQLDYDCDQRDLTFLCQFKKTGIDTVCNSQSQESKLLIALRIQQR